MARSVENVTLCRPVFIIILSRSFSGQFIYIPSTTYPKPCTNPCSVTRHRHCRRTVSARTTLVEVPVALARWSLDGIYIKIEKDLVPTVVITTIHNSSRGDDSFFILIIIKNKRYHGAVSLSKLRCIRLVSTIVAFEKKKKTERAI